MSHLRIARLGIILAAFGFNLGPAMLGMSNAHAAMAEKADSVRPDMYKLVDPAAIKLLMEAKNYTQVQTRLDQAAALAALTPYETFVLNRLRISLAAASHNSPMALAALQAVIASNRLSTPEQSDFILALANEYFNAKDYANAVTWFLRYQKEGGDSAKVRPYLIRAYFYSDDFAMVKQEVQSDLQAVAAAGKKPQLDQLQMLAISSNKTKDNATYSATLEKLVQFYPSDDYWSELLNRLQSKAAYSERLNLDVYRLEHVALSTMPADDVVDMGELALKAGFPVEAKNAADGAYLAGLFGKGPNAVRQTKLRDQADKGAADDLKNIAAGEASAAKSKDGTGMLNLGYAYVTMQQFDKGIDLILKGISKGGLKNPQDAKLRLGIAYTMAGRKAEALTAMADVKGDDGLGDLARYWTLYINRPAPAAAK